VYRREFSGEESLRSIADDRAIAEERYKAVLDQEAGSLRDLRLLSYKQALPIGKRLGLDCD
jgi:hypothetical protein